MFSFKLPILFVLVALSLLPFTVSAVGGGGGGGAGGSGSSVPFMHPLINLFVFLSISLFFLLRKK